MNILRSYTYNLNATPSTFQDHVTINTVGTEIRCVSADEDFEISIDSGPRIPFGLARAIRTPAPFAMVELFRNPAAVFVDNPVTVVVSTGAYQDDRAVISSRGEVAITRASSLISEDIVFGAGVPVPATGGTTYVIAVASNTLLVNVRNQSATAAVRVHTDLAEIALGKGYYIGPGENADIPFGGPAAMTTATLYVKGAIGETCIYTRFIIP